MRERLEDEVAAGPRLQIPPPADIARIKYAVLALFCRGDGIGIRALTRTSGRPGIAVENDNQTIVDAHDATALVLAKGNADRALAERIKTKNGVKRQSVVGVMGQSNRSLDIDMRDQQSGKQNANDAAMRHYGAEGLPTGERAVSAWVQGKNDIETVRGKHEFDQGHL